MAERVRAETKKNDGTTAYEVWIGKRLYWRRVVNDKSPYAAEFHRRYARQQADMLKAAVGP